MKSWLPGLFLVLFSLADEKRPSVPTTAAEALGLKDRWAIHVEFLKVIVTLSAGILTAAVAIYSDTTKIPRDSSKWPLLGCAVFVFLTLVTSLLSCAALSNVMLNSGAAGHRHERRVTIFAGLSFYTLMLAGLCLIVFVALRSGL
jgi:hypothetical protein